MKFKLAEPLSFILKRTSGESAPVMEGYIEVINGCHCIVAGDFKQFIKASELKAITEKNILKGEAAQQTPVPVAVQEPETAKAEEAVTDAPVKGRGTRRK